MKFYTITLQDILNALKHQWKCILISTLIFALLGLGGGWFYAGRGAAESGGSAEALAPVDFAAVPYTQEYYTDCFQLISDSYNKLGEYLLLILNSAAPDKEQTEALKTLSTEIDIFNRTVLLPLQQTVEQPGTIYAPPEFLDTLVEQYTCLLGAVQMDLIAAETAAETIRQTSAIRLDDILPDNTAPASTAASSDAYLGILQTLHPSYFEDKTATAVSSCTLLLTQAAQYGNLLKDQAAYEKILNRLVQEPGQFRSESLQVGQQLETAAQNLNSLLAKGSQLANDIAESAHINIAFRESPQQNVYRAYGITGVNTSFSAQYQFTHSHRASSVGEAFALIALFCALTGLCIGVFLAVYREVKAVSTKSK